MYYYDIIIGVHSEFRKERKSLHYSLNFNQSKSTDYQWNLTDLTVKSIFSTDESVKINWFNSEKYFFTDESVKRQITDSISENLTNSDLESRKLNIFSINSLNPKQEKLTVSDWKTTISNVIRLPRRNQWNLPDSTRETHWLISEIYRSRVKFAGQPVSFPSDVSYILLILCGRLITFETVVFYCSGFRETTSIFLYLSIC